MGYADLCFCLCLCMFELVFVLSRVSNDAGWHPWLGVAHSSVEAMTMMSFENMH
ncbi:hypothetical protein M758_UG040200 [Ceratodon purpureus]|nr:hypothetical protein M758_UG040200 [Ceratodon purpureus]